MNKNLPLISIVTPSLNQAEYIEDTIKSVLNQDYANFEHIIIDGGSTDGTIEILKKYPHLKWVSEKDTGQSNAINKGFRLCRGEIIAWLNSDDYYEENIFKKIVDYFVHYPICHFLYGNIKYVDKEKSVLNFIHGPDITIPNLKKNPNIVRQPSCFWRREILSEIGFLDEKLHLVMDYDFILRILKRYEPHFIDLNFSYYRSYNENKTNKFVKKQLFEIVRVMRKNLIVNPYALKILFGSYLDSLESHNQVKRFFSLIRKK